jgi:hypothetical protein
MHTITKFDPDCVAVHFDMTWREARSVSGSCISGSVRIHSDSNAHCNLHCFGGDCSCLQCTDLALSGSSLTANRATVGAGLSAGGGSSTTIVNNTTFEANVAGSAESAVGMIATNVSLSVLLPARLPALSVCPSAVRPASPLPKCLAVDNLSVLQCGLGLYSQLCESVEKIDTLPSLSGGGGGIAHTDGVLVIASSRFMANQCLGAGNRCRGGALLLAPSCASKVSVSV